MTHDPASGARLAILASRFDGIVAKMANTLFRTARSGVLNSGHDFSCALLTADCRLLAAAESLPAHVMHGPDLVARYVAETHPDVNYKGPPATITFPRHLARGSYLLMSS